MMFLLGIGLFVVSGLFISSDDQRDVENIVRDYILNNLRGEANDVIIEFRNIPESMLMLNDHCSVSVVQDRGLKLRGNVSLPVELNCDDDMSRRHIVSTRVRTFDTVYVVAENMFRNEKIQKENLLPQRIETTALNNDVVTTFDTLIGKRLNRMVTEGTILRKSMLEEMPVIERGDAVTLTVTSGSVTVSTQAVARQDGRVGDIIAVQRNGTHTRFRARVIDDNTVELISEYR